MQSNRRANGIAHKSAIFLSFDRTIIGDEVLDELGTGEGADNGRGEEEGGHGVDSVIILLVLLI